MLPQEIIERTAAFEQDLAEFYQRLEALDKLGPLQQVLQFMHKHSAIHAQLIRNYRPESALPELNLEPLETLHTRIKSVLHQQLAAADDLSEVCDQLAQAEALISRAYAVIAEHFQKTADVYVKLVHKFKSLADDEMQHHDHLLKQSPAMPRDSSEA